MTINKEYMEILKDRLEYFQDKRIVDLSDSEIHEFLNLKKEIQAQWEGITDVFKSAWREVYGASWDKYKERVLNK